MERVIGIETVVELGSAFFPALLGSVTQFTIGSLQNFLAVLTSLRPLYVIILKSPRVGPPAPVAPQSLIHGQLLKRKVLHAADVPVAHTVEL